MKIRSLASSLANAVSAQRSAAQEIQRNFDEIRSRIREIRGQLRDAHSAAPDTAGIRERATIVVSQLADEARGRIYFQHLRTEADEFDAATFIKSAATVSILHAPPSVGGGTGLGFTSKTNVTPLHLEALLRPDDLTAMLVREAEAGFEGASELRLSTKEREALIQRLTSELDELERADEAACREAESAGFNVERRTDADPRWLLAADSDLRAA
ncbi:MAG: hypothetical protein J0I54_12190 [Bosea sp.]|uniref:hypothetical protein n=1 Tax=unclassified Bosea (in: a-proteobacteria) TaxID=2653178 RepID=UPI0009666AD2|nr:MULTISPECIES: hypothetical protein [unclassified Bosea (in: a-proteobacteria)]MBN9457379.1 hypothetical protein [Bosea sp. (in: a-proteobacteria)]OJV09635.1 MAG: hypothetical protein BGO20_02925 [Bosea sp. 67-29]